MSLQRTIAKREEEIVNLKSAIESLEGKVSELTAKNAEIAKALADLQTEAAAKDIRVVESAKASSEEIETLKASAEATGEELSTAQDELATARAALANPAFAHAAIEGRDKSISDGGQGVDEDKAEDLSLWEQYNALETPEERTTFWNANEEGMKEEQKAAAKAKAKKAE